MRFGSLAPTAAVQSVLRDVYNGATQYANWVLQNAGQGISGLSASGLQYTRDALDWQRGSGAGVAAGTIDWSTYREQLTSYGQLIVSVGQQANLDMGEYIAWWDNTAAPRLNNLTVAATVGQTGQAAGDTLGAGLEAASNAVPWWVWGLGAVGLLVYVSGFMPRPR